MNYDISFILNNEKVNTQVPANMTLLNMLREIFDLTGAKEGCAGGECGSCTVIMNKKAVNGCLVLAIEADGAEILTVEGLAEFGAVDELQASFIDNAALQCGYCTPGMIMSAKALLMENKTPNEKDVINAISGNLCRCTGYKKIIEAIMQISRKNAMEGGAQYE